MTPPGSLAPKPIAQPTVPEAVKPAEPKAEGKGPAQDKDPKTQTETKKDSSQDSYWTNPRNYLGRFRIGPSWAEFNNGVGLLEDHSGGHVGFDLGLKLRFGPKDQVFAYGGLSYEHGWYSREIPGGIESKASFHAFGPMGGIGYHIVPDWVSAGLELFVGYSSLGSECKKVKDEEFGTRYCDGLSGTVFNTDIAGAQANPLDQGGARISIGLPLSFVRDILVVKPEFNFNTGHGATIETVTQGTFTQNLNPVEFKLTFGLDLAPAIGWGVELVRGKKENKAPKSSGVQTPEKVKKADAAAPDKKESKTLEANFKVLLGYAENAKKAADKARALATEINKVYYTNPIKFANRGAKNTKIAELAEAVKTQANLAQIEQTSSVTLAVEMEGQINKLPEGLSKVENKKTLEEIKKKMANHAKVAYQQYSKAKFVYERYLKLFKDTRKVELDVTMPAGYVAPKASVKVTVKSQGGKSTSQKPSNQSDPIEKKQEKKAETPPPLDFNDAFESPED